MIKWYIVVKIKDKKMWQNEEYREKKLRDAGFTKSSCQVHREEW